MPKRLLEAFGVMGTIVGVVGVLLLVTGPRVKAHDDDDDHGGTEAKVRIGFEIAPVPLNLKGKNRDLVGLGSYIVNAQADCNGCHTSDPTKAFTPDGNPYLLKPVFSGKQKVNPATYLGGGSDFGSFVPGSYDFVTRNLTPDKTGLPEGGHTLEEFMQIMRTGIDFDHVHPTCGGPGAPVNPGCVPWPFNGDLLQIMPWPTFKNMSDRDLHAIYEYLSAIPCIEGPPAPSILHNDCH